MSYQYNKIDPVKIEDCIQAVLISFNIELEKDELNENSTLGELYKLVEEKLATRKIDDSCTTQQAFYKLRHSIAQTLGISEKEITPSTSLERLFPRYNRRQQIAMIEKDAGISKKFLKMKNWVAVALGIGILASVILVFFFWKEALMTLGVLVAAFVVLSKFRNELRYKSLGEVVADLALFDYTAFRRDPDIFNLTEIRKSINEIFIRKVAVKPEWLKPDLKLFQ